MVRFNRPELGEWTPVVFNFVCVSVDLAFQKTFTGLWLAKRGRIEKARPKRGAAGGLLIFQMLPQSLIHIKVLLLGLQKIVDSQISTGDRMKPLSRGHHYQAETF